VPIAHTLCNLQLNPAAAIIIPIPIRSSFSLKCWAFAPLSIVLYSVMASLRSCSKPSDSKIFSEKFPIILWRVGCTKKSAHFSPGVTSWLKIGLVNSHASLAALSHHTLKISSRERFCSNKSSMSFQGLESAWPLTQCKEEEEGGMMCHRVRSRSDLFSWWPRRQLNIMFKIFYGTLTVTCEFNMFLDRMELTCSSALVEDINGVYLSTGPASDMCIIGSKMCSGRPGDMIHAWAA